MDLAPRQRLVLKTVVENYVERASPVPSESVSRNLHPRVSPATVRNEMGYLEEQGFLFHPHTSAGRIPSDLGYRYYVEHLMEDVELPPAEKRTIQHQFHQLQWDIEGWVHLATAITANAIRSAAMVTPPSSRTARLRRIELVWLAEQTVLLVVLLSSGALRQQVLVSPEPPEREYLVRLSNQLSDQLEGKSARDTLAATSAFVGWEREIVEATARLLRDTDRHQYQEVYYEGLRHIVAQPEFAQSEKLRPILEVLERKGLLGPLLNEALDSGQVRIIIGSEHPVEDMRECSIVLAQYGLAGELQGVIGVIGPTRLAYWRAVPLVRFMSGLMSLLLESAYR